LAVQIDLFNKVQTQSLTLLRPLRPRLQIRQQQSAVLTIDIHASQNLHGSLIVSEQDFKDNGIVSLLCSGNLSSHL